MEVFIRCEIPDVPGALATLAGAIAEAGGDILAVEVAETGPETVIDDLWVTTQDIATLKDTIEHMADATLIHASPSRGLPGDATARLAAGIDALLTGAMSPEDGLPTLIGGLLRAQSAEMSVVGPEKKNRRMLALPVSNGVLVLEREYRFLDSESQRARQIITVCEHATRLAEDLVDQSGR
ncbi:ACT domain-containing protein [Euzebya tangerina]|uniref:ACT domain-containing protein n=1 Tax=Euzebya tangerina TaxID=591198 RepID=UPI0013C2F1E6|nr:ACT domain-containing protein [Euzebya tangerina]